MSNGHAPSVSRPGEHAVHSHWWRRALYDIIWATLLFALCVGIGFAFNLLRGDSLPLWYRSPAERLQTSVTTLRSAPTANVPPAEGGKSRARTIDLEAFQAFVFDHRGVVIDARAAAFYRQGHVPGAISLPREEFSTVYPLLASTLAPQKDKDIAVYCSEPECPDAGLVADALTGLGFSPVMVYQDGWEEWVRAGLPQESATR